MTIYLFLFIIGSCFGSFISCVSYRIVRNEDWLFKRSKCDYCNNELRCYDLIPIFSYLFNKGRCRYCHNKINISYLVIEIFSGLLFVLLFINNGKLINYIYIERLILIIILIGLSYVDIKIYIIPDGFIIIGIINYLLFSIIEKNYFNILNALIRSITIFIFLLLLVLIMNKLLKKESMGGGDLKLIFMLSLYFDLYQIIMIIIIACIISLIYLLFKKKDKIAFGPALSIASIICLFI